MSNLKKHWLLFVGIIIIGVYSFAPHFLFVQELGDAYRGVYLANTSDELYYHSRVQEFFDGHPGVGNAYIYEHKQDPFIQPPLAEAIIFGFGKLTGLQGTDLALTAYKFVLPILLFIVLYSLFHLLSKGNKWLAFLFGLSVLMATNLLVNPKDLLDLLSLQGFSNNIQIYSRPINPQVSSLFFFGYLIFFYLSLVKPQKFYFWLAALFLGGAFYVYPYTWTFILVLNILLLLIYAWRKDSATAKKILGITFSGLIISLPYWWWLWQAMQTEAFSFAANTRGLRYTHLPIFSKVALSSLILFIIAWLIDKSFFTKRAALFIGAMIITGWIVINQQVITGLELFHGHYHIFYNIPILILVTFYILHFYKKWFSRFIYNFVTSLLLIVVLISGLLTVNNIKEQIFPIYAQQQKYGEVVEWINTETAKDDVIVSTDMELNSIIPAYTRANILTAFPATWYLVPPEELRFRYFVYLRFMGVESNLESYKAHLVEYPIEPLTLAGELLSERDHNCPECVTDQMVERLVAEYQSFYVIDFKQQLQKYRLDYLVLPVEKQDFVEYNFLTLLKQAGNFIYYKIDI